MAKDKKKRGAGTRGGVIVGYTKTGNPIYSKKQRVAGVSDKKPTKKVTGKEKQRREAKKEKTRDVASALPEGQRKKVQNLITKLKHKKTSKSVQDFVDKFKLSKSDRKKIEMDKKDFIKEHKRLISVLDSKSHRDDKKEAKKQEEELKEYTSKSVGEFVKMYKCGEVKCGPADTLAGKICRKNKKKTHKYKDK